jgi:hypothetical protein
LQALRVTVADPIAQQQRRLDYPLLARRWTRIGAKAHRKRSAHRSP